ncbi:MAG: toll/interleukin-1 receptor domain-containing protein [Proteobacteria bacterium]|nr:toll/interleukin-1 receptor domain-containing protein [Pseudomonadota bacterium]
MLDTPFPAYTGDEPYIFVSYAHADNEIVYPEIQWLRDQGFNVWYDEGISPGTVWRDELADSIEGSNLYLSNIANTRGPG